MSKKKSAPKPATVLTEAEGVAFEQAIEAEAKAEAVAIESEATAQPVSEAVATLSAGFCHASLADFLREMIPPGVIYEAGLRAKPAPRVGEKASPSKSVTPVHLDKAGNPLASGENAHETRYACLAAGSNVEELSKACYELGASLFVRSVEKKERGPVPKDIRERFRMKWETSYATVAWRDAAHTLILAAKEKQPSTRIMIVLQNGSAISTVSVKRKEFDEGLLDLIATLHARTRVFYMDGDAQEPFRPQDAQPVEHLKKSA
jgi:hypothetical protein